MSGPGPGGSFGGGARACGGRSASFSRSAAFRTCSSGTCRLTGPERAAWSAARSTLRPQEEWRTSPRLWAGILRVQACGSLTGPHQDQLSSRSSHHDFSLKDRWNLSLDCDASPEEYRLASTLILI
uniref:Uncharacterized protein n=1 Tax=Sus scrofa TaxID=9823 RepID=A0A480FUX8_PIG